MEAHKKTREQLEQELLLVKMERDSIAKAYQKLFEKNASLSHIIDEYDKKLADWDTKLTALSGWVRQHNKSK